MTLPASGAISLSQVSVEVGQAATYSASLNWVKSITKDSVSNMASLYSRSYYQSSIDGNCNNGNCANPAGGGNINCVNCSLEALANCSNCDTQAWLQGGVNCACTYNCTQIADQLTNCNCNCACHCFWSDDTLKNRQGDISDALGIVESLTGFYYTGNDKAKKMGLNTNLDVGISAQDVERVFPVAMGTNMSYSDVKQVRYERLVPLLLEAIKQLNQKIDTLKK